jgi:tetratricopeptide (TPR) repeat protein
VSSTGLLTSEDLDELGHSAFDAEDPLAVVAELVAAVDAGRLADVADTTYALALAAEIAERQGDLQAAAGLADRAVQANRVYGRSDYGYPQALYGELLLRLGRVDEAMVELNALRPMLTRDEDAVSYVSEALHAGGRTEVALEWLTAALETALANRLGVASRRGEPVYEQAAVVAFALAQQRHRLRRELDLPHDEHDHLADQLQDAADELLDTEEDEYGYEGTAVLFWPRTEFDRLMLRWPRLVESYGSTWDEHRAVMERALVRLAESGHATLAVLAGAVDELAGYAERRGGDPTDAQVRQGYVEHLQVHPRRRLWPPQRNEACWCGSGLKYKKCCLPRSRT